MNWPRCFVTIFMLTAPVSVAAAAEPPCFEMYQTGSGPEGSILLNKCSGESWMLVGVNAGGGSSLGWHPIPIDMSSEDAPETPDAPAKDDESAKPDADDAAHAD